MNFDKLKNLSTEQKQQLVVLVVFIGGLLYAAFEFGLKPIRQEKQAIVSEIETLQNQLQRGRRLLNTKEATAKDYRKTRDEIRTVMSERLPPYENALSWATGEINKAARNVDIEETDLAISDRGGGTPFIRTKGRDAKPGILNVFRVGVDFSASYHTLGRFIAAIESNNPYVHVSLLTISGKSRGDDPRLNVTLECVFPQFARDVFPPSAHPDEPLPMPPSDDNE